MHYIRAHAEMFSKLWPKVSDQRHLLVSQSPVKSGTTPVTVTYKFQQAEVTSLCKNSTKIDGKEKAEAQRRMREREKWEIAEREGEKKKTVGSVSCGCDTGVLINSEGAGVSQHASGPPSHCQASPGAPPFSPKKGSKLPSKNYRPRASLRHYSYSAGVWENVLHTISVLFI